MSEVINCKMIFATSFHHHVQIDFKTHVFHQLVMSFESDFKHWKKLFYEIEVRKVEWQI